MSRYIIRGAILGIFSLGIVRLFSQQPSSFFISHESTIIETTGQPLSAAPSSLGHWIGNLWFPPENQPLYRPEELHKIFAGQRVVWIGEPDGAWTFQQAALDTINKTHKTTRDLDEPQWQNYKTTKCAHPQVQYCYSNALQVIEHHCFGALDQFLQGELQHRSSVTANATLLVLALGIQEVDMPQVCAKKWKYRNVTSTIQSTHQVLESLQRLQTLRPQLYIVWRTTGFSEPTTRADVKSLNGQVRQELSSRNIVDWASAMEPRSFGRGRLAGSNPSLYNGAARFVLVQQIAHRLVQETGMLLVAD